MTAASAWTVLALSLAGGVGAAARFVVDGWTRSRVAGPLPAGTILVNVSGSFLIGVVTGCVLYLGAGSTFRLVLATGFCGGYTTFSTAMVESVRLAESGRRWPAAVNAFGTLLVTVGAVAAGLGVVRLFG